MHTSYYVKLQCIFCVQYVVFNYICAFVRCHPSPLVVVVVVAVLYS